MTLSFKVKEEIFDKQDNNYIYKVGDTFPREGLKVSDERINEIFKKINAKWNFKDFTVGELRNHLDVNKIEYDAKAKKADLLKLVGD